MAPGGGSRLILAVLSFVGALGAQTCTFTLTATPQSFPISGGVGTVNIAASSGSCSRTAASTVSWITISFGQTGTGNGSAGFTVAANNDGPSRTGTITVGAQSITITQAGPPCNFAINPSSASISALSQSGALQLTGLAGCPWTAVSNASWLQVTSGGSGTGPATINYSALANTATTPRSGAILVAGMTFTVNQAGVCSYTITPTSLAFSSVGGNGMFTVNSAAGCAWTTTSSASWIRLISGQTGAGSGRVAFAVDSNLGDARSGTLTVAGETFTVTQSSASCSFTLTPGSVAVPVIGGTATIGVSGPANCTWTAATTATWIRIITGASGSGAGVIGISVAANPDNAARTATVTVGGQVFTVTQSGPPLQISLDSIANAASYASGAVSPGLVVVITVPRIGPEAPVVAQLTGDNLFIATELGETRILFDGVAAPMTYASRGQFGAIVPYAVAGKSTTEVQVEFKGERSNRVTVPVVESSPGLFSLNGSGSGPGAILNQRGHINSSAMPAPRGSVVVVYATGEGQTFEPGVDGKLAVAPLAHPILPVSVTIDGLDAEVSYAGAAPGQVAGLMQINVRIPTDARSGEVPLLLRVGQYQSQTGVTVAVE